MTDINEQVEQLLGDFFERNTAGDKEGMNEVLLKIQNMLYSGDVDGKPFKDYFNSMYTGRSAINVAGMVNDYPRESILRELLQNVFGCDYEDNDIKVMIEFLDEGQVKLTYNETGFRLEQVFYYLSVGRSESGRDREGRFGLGAKSVFANVDWFKMRSNNYYLRVVNDGGTLKVRDLELTAQKFKHTEIVFALDEEDQKKLHDNLVTMTSEKGDYINMIDLCFAFIKKKHLKSSDENEAPNRTFNIAVISFGKPEMVYKIQQYRRDENDIPKIRFSENGKSVADFIHMEENGFVYLIPYAISGAKREAAKVLMSRYNYFSTFELTGLVKVSRQDFLQEKLSAFFVSVPNRYVTNNRAGIRHDCIEEVSAEIEEDILNIVDEYKRLFVLQLTQRPDDPEKYMLRPAQYVFEFFYNYINTSTLIGELRDKFAANISIKFPDSEEPVSFSKLRECGYFNERSDIDIEDHDNGNASRILIDDLGQMSEWYGVSDGDHVFAAKYDWYRQETNEHGVEYAYSFQQNGHNYLLTSDKNPKIKDYGLSDGFMSIISLKLNSCIVNGAVSDENALAEAFRIMDEMFGSSYRIDMKYFQFIITSGGTEIQFEISKIQIGNLKKAMDVIQQHEARFDSHHIYNQVISLIVNSFTNGKDTMQFLREIKSQGGEVSLALDINKRYRFSAYGKQFMIPPNITNTDLLEIVGDVYLLIESGMFNGRVFDFPYAPNRYDYDPDEIINALPQLDGAEEIGEQLTKIYICDLSLDKIALLDENNKILNIIDNEEAISPDIKAKTKKYIVLRDGLTKPKFSSFIEFILTGSNNDTLAALYSSTEEPNQVLVDQIPYYYKPVPIIQRKEFDFLRNEIKRIADIKNPRLYKNYFARDINAKLYGYGGICPCCGYESKLINSFILKSFSIGLLNQAGKEQKFRFSLYLCANDNFAAGGWIIDDVSIGGMSPFLWLEEISQIDNIPPEFLYCRIKYRPQVTYAICEAVSEGESITNGTVYDGSQEVLDFTLTPMMVAKWFEDNQK